MIYLFSGVPGAGKTAFAIDHLLNHKDPKPNRVFYIGLDIKLRPLGWEEITAHKLVDWESICEPGDVFFIDEAQDYLLASFRIGYSPEWIQNLAKHRHKGIDFYLTSQSHDLLSPFVQRLIDTTYVLRPHKARQSSHFWKLKGVPISRKQDYRLKELYRFNKDVFNLYKSTDMDLSKTSLSLLYRRFRFLLLLLFIILFVGGFWVYSSWMDRFIKPVQATINDNLVTSSVPVSVSTFNDDFASGKRFYYAGQIGNRYFFEVWDGKVLIDLGLAGMLEYLNSLDVDLDKFTYSDRLKTFAVGDFYFERGSHLIVRREEKSVVP